MYAWILIKYQLHFDFLVVFTPPKALSTSLPCFVVIVLLKSALTSGRTLPGTTFFVLKFEATLQRRSWFGNFLHRCNSAVYRCQRAFPAARNSHFLLLLQPALLQLFCSASWSHSAALQQRCSFRTGIASCWLQPCLFRLSDSKLKWTLRWMEGSGSIWNLWVVHICCR